MQEVITTSHGDFIYVSDLVAEVMLEYIGATVTMTGGDAIDLSNALRRASDGATGAGARLEHLADIEHQQWAHWTEHMLEVLRDEVMGRWHDIGGDIGGAGSVPHDEAVREFHEWWESLTPIERWRKQIATAYTDLSEKEKDSDRHWARRALGAIER